MANVSALPFLNVAVHMMKRDRGLGVFAQLMGNFKDTTVLTEPPQVNLDSRVKKPVVQSVGKIEAI